MLAVPAATVNAHQCLGKTATIPDMAIPDPLLDILVCPVSHEPLRPLEKRRLKALNQRIDSGEVQYVDHSDVNETARDALITRDDKVIYLVFEGIPVLLPDRGIGTTQFTDPL
jgi:uncharacterized protein